MNLTQTAQLLTVASMIDNRTVAPETVQAWHKAVGHLNYDDALEAVTLHFSESDKYLLPAHVVANVKVIQRRQDRAERVQLAVQRGPVPAQQVTLDRDTHEREFRAALAAERVRKGLDPETGKPVADA